VVKCLQDRGSLQTGAVIEHMLLLNTIVFVSTPSLSGQWLDEGNRDGRQWHYDGGQHGKRWQLQWQANGATCW
jgi:hypothetical protein